MKHRSISDVSNGPQTARQVGRACRRHRHRHRKSPSASTRHLPLAALGERRSEVGEPRIDRPNEARQQYEWAIPHIENGLGAIQLSRLDRQDVAAWIDDLAAGGKLGRRSIRICRTVVRAALSEAVDEGHIPRSPAARVGLPRTVAKEAKPTDS